jgi:hypothetical protein
MTVDPSAALLQPIFDVSQSIRYVALKEGDDLLQRQRSGVANASESESDRYEELFVNPALLTLAGARGDLDCGGFHYLIIRYGNFFQIVFRLDGGHLSVCVEESADPQRLAQPIMDAYATLAAKRLKQSDSISSQSSLRGAA